MKSARAAAEPKEGGEVSELGQLPEVDGKTTDRVFLQQLAQPTALEETVAVHVKPPPLRNRELESSLVRVVGTPDEPVVMFRSDALAELGHIPKSPGSDFFTLFAPLPEEELIRRVENEKRVESGEFGEFTREAILFNGRHPISRFMGAPFELRAFRGGQLVPLSACPARPVFTQQLADQALFVKDPAVVLDPARTWDPCTGAGTQGGKWTFAHLMRELAQGSGSTPEAFVANWLALWLNDYTVNSDTVPKREQMFTQVIQPWATASGVTATMTNVGGTNVLSISGAGLDLDIAPFRLLAIVNRVDLATNTGGGYGGSSKAGELRFVFGVVNPDVWGGGGNVANCQLKPFTVIFEYGVPASGCSKVIDWAQQWAQLATYPGFTSAYLTQLETMTESVVLHGKAPAKGNDNALNQIRTNEIALGLPVGMRWELREFTLTNENPAAGTDTPSDGLLRPHTVALTPDDATHDPNTDVDVDTFVRTIVKAAVTPTPPVIPTDCTASFKAPFSISGRPFLGGNALVNPPTHWEALNLVTTSAEEVCARKEFSINTCNGCHFADSGTNGGTSTSFMHVDATSGIPATLSKFLTGGGPNFMFGVPDQQVGFVTWQFNDLRRRHQRLYDIATCSTCSPFVLFDRDFLSMIQEVSGVVPIDLPPRQKELPFRVGPIKDIGTMKEVLERRPDFKRGMGDVSVDTLRPAETFVH
ncbi:MAG TPA: hypothetical protein VE153_16185 [Myxococcus sp.]|nr:hypothetical protein [Myxococcus sp.]